MKVTTTTIITAITFRKTSGGNMCFISPVVDLLKATSQQKNYYKC